jgi:hypothetical protein
LYSLVAFLMARFALRFAIQPMWVRVVTGSDIVGANRRDHVWWLRVKLP